MMTMKLSILLAAAVGALGAPVEKQQAGNTADGAPALEDAAAAEPALRARERHLEFATVPGRMTYGSAGPLTVGPVGSDPSGGMKHSGPDYTATVGSGPSGGSVPGGDGTHDDEATHDGVDKSECPTCCEQACFEAKTKGCRTECPKECDELMPGSTLVGTGKDRVCECLPKPCEMNEKNVEPVCLGATPMIDNGDGTCVMDLPAECSHGDCYHPYFHCPAHCPKDCAVLNPLRYDLPHNTRFITRPTDIQFEGPDGIPGQLHGESQLLVQRMNGSCCSPGPSSNCL
jgi:hypothetical protein